VCPPPQKRRLTSEEVGEKPILGVNLFVGERKKMGSPLHKKKEREMGQTWTALRTWFPGRRARGRPTGRRLVEEKINCPSAPERATRKAYE